MNFKILFLFFISIIFNSNLIYGHGNFEKAEIEQRSVASTEHKEYVDFKFTDEEFDEISKWKDKTLNDVVIDALNCDRAALYMTGMSLITGLTGLTIDVDEADLFFSESASLGFAPALKQLIHKNIETNNIFLVLVYNNLMTSLGHKEYIYLYHDLRTKALAIFGSDAVKEIEKIAKSKKEQIDKNIEDLKICKDKKLFYTQMITVRRIDYEDKNLNSNYWMRFTKFQKQAEEEADRFEYFVHNDLLEWEELYQKSKTNFSEILHMFDDSIDNREITDLKFEALKNAKKALKKNEELITLMKEFDNSSSENLRRIAKEFSTLLTCSKSLLELHCTFFLSPDKFLDSSINIEKLEEHTAEYNIQKENTKKILDKLTNNQ